MIDSQNSDNKFISMWNNLKSNKKLQLIIGGVIILLVIAVVVIAMVAKKNDNSSSNTNSNKSVVSSDQSYRRIDGVLADTANSNSMPIAIVVENYKDVRPQSGLSQANIVYEALAEGGITRFLAIFASSEEIKEIGPVRSARPYFVDIAEEYNGIYAHIGGSPQALGILNTEEYLTDINQFYNSQYFWRDENIPAPHNVFTSSQLMSYAVRDEGLDTTKPDYQAWQFKEDQTIANSNDLYIKVNYSLEDYFVEWKYNNDSNTYTRWNGNIEQKDKNNDQSIVVKNVIVQFADTGLIAGEDERLEIKTIGEGKALIFLDGQVIDGTWKKENRGNRTTFYDNKNEEVKFNRGSTWVNLVKTDTGVEWNDVDNQVHTQN